MAGYHILMLRDRQIRAAASTSGFIAPPGAGAVVPREEHVLIAAELEQAHQVGAFQIRLERVGIAFEHVGQFLADTGHKGNSHIHRD